MSSIHQHHVVTSDFRAGRDRRLSCVTRRIDILSCSGSELMWTSMSSGIHCIISNEMEWKSVTRCLSLVPILLLCSRYSISPTLAIAAIRNQSSVMQYCEDVDNRTSRTCGMMRSDLPVTRGATLRSTFDWQECALSLTESTDKSVTGILDGVHKSL